MLLTNLTLHQLAPATALFWFWTVFCSGSNKVMLFIMQTVSQNVLPWQDIVTRGGKMVFLYKRPGQRVILNDFGHMMVRPTHMESSVQRTTAGEPWAAT